MTENLREQAQLDPKEGPQEGQEALLIATVEVSEGHGSFTARRTRLATADDMARLGWVRKRGKK